MSAVLLLFLIGLPFAVGLATGRLAPGRPERALAASLAAAVALVVLATLAPLDAVLALPSGRRLVLAPIAQLGIQLMGLAVLGFTLALSHDPDEEPGAWLPIMWLSSGGLAVALLFQSLPLALVVFVASTLLWVFGLRPEGRPPGGGPVLRYAALLGLTLPLLLGAFRLADVRMTSAAGRGAVEGTVLALALPGFALILGLVPLHAWALTLAAGAPRTMLFGVLGVVQTAGFALLLRTLQVHEWLFRGQYGGVVTLGGALTAVVAGWFALSSDPDDPDDWMTYAVVANMGILVAALGTGSRAAGTGAALLLLARVLALVLLALRAGASPRYARLATGAAALTLAGAPGLAGFPGLWLILTGSRAAGGPAAIAIAAGSGLVFATGLRHTLFTHRRVHEPERFRSPLAVPRGPDRAIAGLALLLVVLGLAPQLVAGAMTDPLRDIFFPDPFPVAGAPEP